jgi:hypothetical protein
MNILVCLSQVPDTTTKIAFSADNKSLNKTGVQYIINPYDELALTKALELNEDELLWEPGMRVPKFQLDLQSWLSPSGGSIVLVQNPPTLDENQKQTESFMLAVPL